MVDGNEVNIQLKATENTELMDIIRMSIIKQLYSAMYLVFGFYLI